MTPDEPSAPIATATAEEILRLIYGDDLRGCAVNLDEVAAVIQIALQEHARHAYDLAELHGKAFEAVELLATPPGDGANLSAEDLRSLLGERLDKIRGLATQVRNATKVATTPAPENGSYLPDL